MSILVTGGAGFIGSNFIVNSKGRPTVNLDIFTYAGCNTEEFPGCTNIKGSINDFELVTSLLKRYRPEAIVNFAAETHVDRSINAPDVFVGTNILGTHQLLKAALDYWMSLKSNKAFRFIQISTDEVYGTLAPMDPPFKESNQYKPNSPYSASKASADHLVRAYHQTYKLPVIITNCSNNFGAYQFPEKLIPLMVHNCLAGEKLPIYGDGKQVRDWLYVEDHCEAINLVLKEGKIGETYNIGGNNQKTNIELVYSICRTLDKLCPKVRGSYGDQIVHVKDRPGHDRRYAVDTSKIKSQLGWTPKHSFESGLTKTVKWYLGNKQWTTNIAKKKEYRKWMETQYS